MIGRDHRRRRFVLRASLQAILLAWSAIVPIVAAHAAELTFNIRVERGRVPEAMRLVRVKQGDAVKLRWSTDRPLVLHLHGYDVETTVAPGAVAETVFTARASGRFPIHVHAPGTGAHTHETPLVQIEVHPR